MRRPVAPPSPRSRLTRLRPWVLPALAVVLFLTLWEPSYDRDALRDALSDDRPAEALELLALADPRHVGDELSGVNWWPAEVRATRLEGLRQELGRLGRPPEDELVLLAPLGAHRSAPTTARLAHPAPRDLQLQLHNRELGLEAARRPLRPGDTSVEFEVPLLPGTTFDVVLTDPGDDAMLAHAEFRLLSPAQAESVGRLMQTAHDLAGHATGGDLLAALVALHYGLYAEADRRLADLSEAPGYRRLVTELRAVALDRLGLPRRAGELLDGADPAG